MLGVPVINADDIAKALTLKGQMAYTEIVKHFSHDILLTNGEINRAQLRKKIFNNIEARQWLESLLHPLIREELEKKVRSLQAPYCLIEIPLLFHRKDYPYIKRVLTVQAPLEIKIARILSRDSCDRDTALAILRNQADESQYNEIADDILINDDSVEQLQQYIVKLNQYYKQAALHT